MSRSVLAIAWLLALPVVAAAETRIDLDPTKNFSQFKTFAVEVAPPIDVYGQEDPDNTLTENRLRRAVSYQLQMRGLTESPTPESADLIIKVNSRNTEEVVLNAYGPYPYGYGPYGWGYGSLGWGYWGAGYWGPYGNVSAYTYIEQNVRIDIMERKTGELVYRAQVSREAEDDIEDMEKHAMKTARKAFKKYPITFANPYYRD